MPMAVNRNREFARCPLSSVTFHWCAASSQYAATTVLRNSMSRRRSNLSRVGLGGEMLLPVPFRHQLLGKGVAIGPAFGIETRAGITVPVPGAANVRAGLEDPRGHAQFAQAVEHIHPGNPGADDDRVVARELTLAWAFRQGVCVGRDTPAS